MLIPPPATISPGATVWAYLRDSGGEGQDRSVHRQETTIREYCAAHNLNLVKIYKDTAKTGTTTAGRDDFHRLIRDTSTAKNRPQALLLWNFARFARNTDDSIYYKALLRKRGIKIHSLTDPIPDGPYARLIETMIETANAEKSRQTSLDVKASLHALVRQGAIPGTPPRGFRRIPIKTINPRTGKERINHRWEPDSLHIPNIRKAFAMLLAGRSLAEISRETQLYKSLNTYSTFFANPLYKGELHYADIIIKDYCEPIVDEKTWDAAQQILAKRAQAGHLRNPKTHPRTGGKYLLTGLVHCQQCGSPLIGQSSKQRNGAYYRSYACSRAKRCRDCPQKPISAKKLENIILREIKNFITQPAMLAEMLNTWQIESQNRHAATQQEITAHTAQLGILKRQLGHIVNAITESGHSQTLLEKLAELETQIKQTEETIHILKTAINLPLPKLTDAQIKKRSAQLADRLSQKDPAQLRRVLLGIIHEIIVKRDGKRIIALITFYQPKTLKKNETDGAINTTPINRPPVGALLYRRSIQITAKLK